MPSLQDLNDDSAILDAVPQGEARSLGAPSVVDELLRGWTKHILDLKGQSAEGTIPDERVNESLKAEAARLQGIFYGQDSAYTRTVWNHPAQLGRYLIGPVGVQATLEDAVVGLLKAFWVEAQPPIVAFLDDELSEENLLTALEEMIERYRYYLMGLPFPEGYFDEEDEA